jgi:hypothetical protein
MSAFIPNPSVTALQSADYVCGNPTELLFAYNKRCWIVSNLNATKKRVSSSEGLEFAKQHNAEADFQYSFNRK